MGGLSLVAEHGLLIRVAYLLVALGSEAHGLQSLWHTGSAVVAHRLSCPSACGILLDKGSNE